MGVWSGATDDYDAGLDMWLNPSGAGGYAAAYHEKGEGGWEGATGFYSTDIRAGVAADEGKVFAPIYVWADPVYTADVMYFSLQPGGPPLPPTDRQYVLELLGVPAGVTGAPKVGTTWVLPDDLFTLTLPTWATDDGLTGYRFAFTITPTLPEPATLALVAAAALSGRRQR